MAVLTKKNIARLRSHSKYIIPQELEDLLLEKFGQDPKPYVYTEQDIYEQSRKILEQYQLEHRPTLPDFLIRK